MFASVVTMNAITKTPMTVEHHCLQLPYASLRLYKCGLLERLMMSMEQHGQLVPVVIVPKDNQQWVLMDGYLRVKALQRLGQDTVNAEVWSCDLADALLTLLTEHPSRSFEVLEEALLLEELTQQHGFSQQALAMRIGRDQSWVSRRLGLLDQLPESLLKAMTTGKLSLWSATRVLAPMARAMPAHAENLLQYLLKNPLSTRELRSFYDHYQRSNRQERTQMINEPALFFKAQKLIASEKKTKALQSGPEGQWQMQQCSIKSALSKLLELAPKLFTPHQDSNERREMLCSLNDIQRQVDLLTQTIRNLTHAHERNAADHSESASKWTQQTSYQPSA